MFAFRFYIWCVCVRASCCSGLDADTYTYGERAKKILYDDVIVRHILKSHSTFRRIRPTESWGENACEREKMCGVLTRSNAASFNLLYFVVFITISVGFILKELIHVLIRCGMTQITIDFVISSRWPLYYFFIQLHQLGSVNCPEWNVFWFVSLEIVWARGHRPNEY